MVNVSNILAITNKSKFWAQKCLCREWSNLPVGLKSTFKDQVDFNQSWYKGLGLTIEEKSCGNMLWRGEGRGGCAADRDVVLRSEGFRVNMWRSGVKHHLFRAVRWSDDRTAYGGEKLKDIADILWCATICQQGFATAPAENIYGDGWKINWK